MNAPIGRPFLWGTATSAHQVEGGSRHNDWWPFEGAHRSGAAAAFTQHFATDLDHARAMGTNAFRFSLQWARVEPRPGELDEEAFAYYDALIDACCARGLDPMVTLVHFTMPAWARAAGGWRAPAVRAAFEAHVRRVAERFGDRVRRYVTFNEPNVQANAGFVAGLFPPGRRLRFDLADQCLLGLLDAHGRAHRALGEVYAARSWPAPEVGVSPHVIAWRPSRWDVGGVVGRIAQTFNWGFLDALETGVARLTTRTVPVEGLRGTLDFVGLNYYMGLPSDLYGVLQFAGALSPRASTPASDMGWPIAPSGLEEVILEAHRRYDLPVMITENGIADATDTLRPDYIRGHVAAMYSAMAAGADVRGYYHWSLLDNFEWHEGYGPRFGLLSVDYATQARTRTRSFDVYAATIAASHTHPANNYNNYNNGGNGHATADVP